MSETGGTGRTAHPATFQAGDVVGRYVIRRRVGAGGMGVVYEAEDPELGRSVALKLLLGVDDKATHRFLAEARGQARVEHPAICRVYEAGEVDGQRHIAMQFVDGQTIGEAREQMTLTDRVDVMRQVCDGLHAAHRLGLIHRDIKPGNVLVARGDGGGWQPFVTDFGLVKDLAAGGGDLTEAGVPMGSPSYMSPEQARGEIDSLDRRSDVWALGATLYDLLSGAPPHVGQTAVDIILKAVESDAPSLRSRLPDVPADLDAIVMKSLESEPRARYASARAMAEDLERFLAGDVVEARPSGWPTRLWRKARRHKPLVAVVTAAVVAVGVLSGVGLRARWQAQRQAEMAQQLGQEAKDIEWRMHIAHLCPPHDLTAERGDVDRRIDALEAQVQDAGRFAQGPGAYALGRGQLARGDPDRAVEHLQEAWDGGYQHPDVARALGLALGALYQRERDGLVAIQDRELREAREQTIQREYRDPALAYLATTGGEDESRHVAALVAYYDGRFADAVSLAGDTGGLPASHYQSTLLLGRVHADEGVQAYHRGDYDLAAASYDESLEALQRAAEVGRSDPAVHLARADLHSWRMTLRDDLGQPIDADFTAARDACELALLVDPESPEAHLALARALRLAAYHGALHGGDRRALFDEALAAADATIALDPTLADAHFNRGELLSRIGQHQENRQVDPRDTLRDGIVSLERALELDPAHPQAHDRLAGAHKMVGEYEASLGLDPFESYGAAVATLERGIAIHPQQASYHAQLGTVLSMQARALEHTDPRRTAQIQRAAASWDRAMELNPSTPRTYLKIALGQVTIAETFQEEGGDPLPHYDAAIEAMERAIELKPDYIYPHTNGALAVAARAEFQLAQGHDARGDLQRALELCDRAAEIDPTYPAGPNHRGIALVVLAQGQMLFGEDPRPTLEAAEEASRRALELSPEYIYAHGALGMIHHQRARYLHHEGQPSWALVAQARGELRQILDKQPTNPGVLVMAVAVELFAARTAGDRAAAEVALTRAEALSHQALEDNTRCYWASRSLAEASYLRAVALPPGDERAAGLVEAGLEQVASCLARRPDDTQAQIVHGALLSLDGRGRAEDRAEGLAAVEAALAANPTLGFDWEPLLEGAGR